MRSLTFGVLGSATLTFAAALSLRAADSALAVAAVAAVAVLLAWLAGLHSTPSRSGLGLTGPAAAVALAVVRRQPWSGVLPIVTAQVVGAVAAGLGALALEDRLGPTLVVAEPDLAVAAAVAGLAGLVGTWVVFALDGAGPVGLAAVPVVVGGAMGAVALAAAAQPAALLGLAAADLLAWDVAAVAAGGSFTGAVVGAFVMTWLLPGHADDM